jgi:four helix bundle protein
MEKATNEKRYDLDERTYQFASSVMRFVKTLPRTIPNIEMVKQLVRSAGSIGANYIEASEALSKKDFTMRIKICRKEAKETIYWLRLVDTKGEEVIKQSSKLCNEATELMKIFGAILEKSK